jgi:hypothetical protein
MNVHRALRPSPTGLSPRRPDGTGSASASAPIELQARVIQPGALPDTSRFDAEDLRRQIQPPLAQPVIGEWKSPSAPELRAALEQEPTFKHALAAEGAAADQWVGQLAAALERATRSDESAPAPARVAEMIFRFPGAYGAGRVAHIANGAAWRLPDGTLRLAFLHQESLPDAAPARSFTGRFYDTFDTAHDLPDKKAPVAESMKLAGLPAVNVFRCEHPQSLPGITEALRVGVGDHVYASWPSWPGVKEAAAYPYPAFSRRCRSAGASPARSPRRARRWRSCTSASDGDVMRHGTCRRCDRRVRRRSASSPARP